MAYKTVLVTHRSKRHQQAMIDAAPDNVALVILQNPDKVELMSEIADATYLISERSGVIDRELLSSAPQLKLILRLGSLTHDIDLGAAQENDIIVCYWSQKSVIRVAEHAVMQMLILQKQFINARSTAMSASVEWGLSKRTDENTFAYNWSNRSNVMGLHDKIIGILGFGEIGAELARRLSGWDMSILYNKRTQFPKFVEEDLNISYQSQSEIFKQSDIVVNLLPYAKETDLSIDADMFRLMKPSTMLVSVGSGSVIDEKALAAAIKVGQLSGVALDTYEFEPLKPDNPLLKLAHENENIVLTPHIAAGTMSNMDERREHFTNILRHIDGKPIINRLV